MLLTIEMTNVYKCYDKIVDCVTVTKLFELFICDCGINCLRL